MRALLFAAALAALAACSKAAPAAPPSAAPTPTTAAAPTPAAAAAPVAAAPMKADGPAVLDPASLPPPGTAPTPVTVTKELDPMWSATINTLDGKPTTLASFKGKALMLVNVASQCGNTPQYAALEALQKKYGPKGFTVIGFPCNQFAGQEPGTAQEIKSFCTASYGVTFPLMEKIEVNGPGRHDIYKALTQIPSADGKAGDIHWNFEKFVVSADGSKITRFSPRTKPDDPTVIAAVENALPK